MSNIAPFVETGKAGQDAIPPKRIDLATQPILADELKHSHAQAVRELALAAYALEISTLRLCETSQTVDPALADFVRRGALEIGRLLAGIRGRLPDVRARN